VPKLNFIPLGRKKAVSLKKMWLISPAMKSPRPLSDSLSLINLRANKLGNQRTMPARPPRGLFEEHSLPIFDAVIFNIFYELLMLLNFGTASLFNSLKKEARDHISINAK